MSWSAASKRGRIVASIALSLAVFAACADGLSGSLSLRPVHHVIVNPPAASILTGSTQTLIALAVDWNDTVLNGREIHWESEASAVARVSARGVVTAVAPGMTRIFARTDGKRGEAVITVLPIPVAWIDVGAPALMLDEGATAMLVAKPRDAADAVLEGRTVVWSASNPSVADVDQSGRVAGHRIGQSTITATSEGKSAQVLVTVRLPDIATITLSPASLDLEVMDTVTIVATLRDAGGRVLDGRDIQWSVSNPAVATVNAAGVVSARAPGSTLLTASSGSREATMHARVELPPAADLLYQRAVPGTNELFTLSFGPGAFPQRIEVGKMARRPGASPSGRDIVFIAPSFNAEGLGSGNMFVANRSGTILRNLSTLPGTDDAPAWSPPTRPGEVAFTHTDEMTARTDIWTMRADGSVPRNLTADMSEDYIRGDPAWSRDGEWIAFSVSGYRPGAVLGSLWLMRADGSSKRQLTTHPGGGFDVHPSWSADGKFIAFERGGLAILNVATGQVVTLPLSGWVLSPTWSPDGRHLAFSMKLRDIPGANFDLYTVRPDGTGLRLRQRDLTAPMANSVSGTWIARQ